MEHTYKKDNIIIYLYYIIKNKTLVDTVEIRPIDLTNYSF